MGKCLSNKLKLFSAGLAIAGFTYMNFNSATAQTSEKNYIPKYNTTTHYIIKEIQKDNAYIELKTLDKIIDESKKIVKENYKGDPYNTKEVRSLIEKFSKIIEEFQSLTNNDETCYRKSLTYLAMGEANNLPLHTAVIPRHMFVKWDPDSTNNGDFNWDPNWLSSKGFTDYYAELFFGMGLMLTDKKLKERGFFRSLNKNELLSRVYQQESSKLFEKDSHDKAIEYINKSIELTPNFPESYFAKGSFLHRLGKKKCGENLEEIRKDLDCQKYFKEACENYIKSLEGDIGTNSYIQAFTGQCFYYLGEYEKAESYFTQSIENDKNISALKMRAKLYLETNQKEKAKKDIYSCLNYPTISIFESNPNYRFIEHNKKPIGINLNVEGKKYSNWNDVKSSCENLKYADGGWRLPSIEELDLIYQNKKEIPLINLGKIWSSTESEKNEVWIKDMKNGNQEKIKKYTNHYSENNKTKEISFVCVKDLEELKIGEHYMLNKLIRYFELEELIKEAFNYDPSPKDYNPFSKD